MNTQRLAITLWPEWAYAVAHLGKNIENRTWEPPDGLLGQMIAIHGGVSIGGRASKKPGFAFEAIRQMTLTAAMCGQSEDVLRTITPGVVTEKGRGIVAVARLKGVHRHPEGLRWYAGDNLFGWVLGDVYTLPRPVPCMGAQGLWRLHPETLEAVRIQLRKMKSQAAGACLDGRGSDQVAEERTE